MKATHCVIPFIHEMENSQRDRTQIPSVTVVVICVWILIYKGDRVTTPPLKEKLNVTHSPPETKGLVPQRLQCWSAGRKERAEGQGLQPFSEFPWGKQSRVNRLGLAGLNDSSRLWGPEKI